MKKIRMILCIAAGAMMLAAMPAGAATLTTEDGVLSIETPSDKWAQITDPNHWFAMTDGRDTITIDHLSNGETLPSVVIANDVYPAVYHGFVSTKNEVFIVEGQAVAAEDLQTVMEAIGTVKVLKYDTKKAIQKESEAAKASEFGLKLINATYYVVTDELNVRTGCSMDDAVVGTLHYGDMVTVNGSVTRGEQDYGWYQIQFNGGAAYVSSGFLSATKPEEQKANDTNKKASESETNSSADQTGKVATGAGFPVYREDGSYVGDLVQYSDGHYYVGEIPFDANGDGSFFGGAGAGMTVYTSSAWDNYFGTIPAEAEYVQCEYCGEWFLAGNDYRNHVMAAHTGADSDASYDDYTQDYVNLDDGNGNSVTATFEGGAWTDENGVEYYDQNDGTFMSSDGEVFGATW